MRKSFSILFSVAVFISLFFYSCSFSNKASLVKATQVNSGLTFLSPLIRAAFKTNISFFQTYKIQNDTLRKYFAKNGITELSIQYDSVDKTLTNPKNFLSLDSVIIFHCNRSKAERYIYEDFIYSFATLKPKVPLIDLANKKIKQINDSLWIVKTNSKIVTIF